MSSPGQERNKSEEKSFIIKSLAASEKVEPEKPEATADGTRDRFASARPAINVEDDDEDDDDNVDPEMMSLRTTLVHTGLPFVAGGDTAVAAAAADDNAGDDEDDNDDKGLSQVSRSAISLSPMIE